MRNLINKIKENKIAVLFITGIVLILLSIVLYRGGVGEITQPDVDQDVAERRIRGPVDVISENILSNDERKIVVENVAGQVSPTLQSESLLYLDRSDQLLYDYQKGAVSIFEDKIRAYKADNRLVAAIPLENEGELLLYDYLAESRRTIAIDDLGKVISVAVDSSNNKIYLLANYQTGSRDSDIVELDIRSNQTTVLGTTKANVIDYGSDNLILFEYSDGLDDSRVSVFNLRSKTNAYNAQANYFRLSDNKTKLLISYSNFLIFYDLVNNQLVNTYPNRDLVYWSAEDEITIIKNVNNGIVLQSINIDSGDLNTSTIELDYEIRRIIDSNQNTILVQNMDREVLLLEISE